jgi:hypothetical protein
MPKKRPKLVALEHRVAEARRIIEEQQALLVKLRASGTSTYEAEGALRTYASSLMHLLSHEQKMKEEAKAKRGESRKKK